jgi:osmotically-inducible protein OsmY
MKKMVVLILVSLCLTGCIAAAVVGTTGMAVYDRRGMITIEKDARIFHVAHTKIVQDPRFRNSRIVVSSFNKVVLLAGQTPSASLRVLAEKIAQNSPNVTRVYDEITIGEPLPLSQRPRDSWITGQVKSKMLAREGLESGSIRVITEDAIVYLMGIVTKEQSTIAVDVARHVNGVRKVVKIFQYIH